MLKMIFNDIKTMLKRPLLFIVMCLGLAALAFALTLYCITAPTSHFFSKNMPDKDKTVEIYDCSFYKRDMVNLMTVLTDGSLPEIDYASAVAYDSDDYDLIGMYAPSETEPENDEMISVGHLGKNHAVVSADLKDGVELGGSVKLQGINYKIVGVIPAGKYNPVSYDIRRISDSQVRPNKAVIVPMDILPDFVFKGDKRGYFHITFKEAITPSERTEIEETILSAIYGGVVDMSEYDGGLQSNNITEIIVCGAAVVAGLVNIVTLYTYSLRRNKELYGVSGAKLFASSFIELAVYTLIASAIGCICAVLVTGKSGLYLSRVPLKFPYFIGVYLLLLIVQMLVSLKAVCDVSRGDYMPALSRGAAGKTVHAIAAAILCAVFAFELTFGFSYVFDSGHYSRYVKNNFNCAITAFAPSGEFEEGYYENRAECTDEIESCLGMLYNAKGVGRVSAVGSSFAYTDEDESALESDTDKIVFLRSVNDDYVKYSPMPLSKGSWAGFESYDESDETAAIPCIISKDMESRFPLNTRFTLKIELDVDKDRITEIAREFTVCGIADADALRPDHLCSNADVPCHDISAYQLPYTAASEIHKNGIAPAQEFFIPEIHIDGETPGFLTERMPTYYIYSDNYDNVMSWKNDLAQYGTVFSFKELCENFRSDNTGGGRYFVQALTFGVLLLLSTAAYDIMFSENCTKKQNTVRYALMLLLPGIIGSVFGLLAVKELRIFSIDTIYLSAITGFITVVFVFLVFAVISVLRKARERGDASVK